MSEMRRGNAKTHCPFRPSQRDALLGLFALAHLRRTARRGECGAATLAPAGRQRRQNQLKRRRRRRASRRQTRSTSVVSVVSVEKKLPLFVRFPSLHTDIRMKGRNHETIAPEMPPVPHWQGFRPKPAFEACHPSSPRALLPGGGRNAFPPALRRLSTTTTDASI